MIKELDEDREESQDPEVEFAITGAVRECGGLEILLSMVQVCATCPFSSFLYVTHTHTCLYNYVIITFRVVGCIFWIC